MRHPLATPADYEAFIYSLPDCYPSIERSLLVYILRGALFGRVVGLILFAHHVVLCVQEFLNFELGVIEGYGYEVSRSRVTPDLLPPANEYCRASYPEKEKLYWYDSFPHPGDPALASTDPHHKHVPPDIKHHRVPAPDLTFTAPNLPFLIEEIEQAVLADGLPKS
jgi:hypothetical protein